MKRIFKVLKKRKGLKKKNASLVKENASLVRDMKKLINEIDEKDNKINELEFELSKDFQAQKIENQAYLITKLREGKKLNADEMQKERRKRIEAQEENRKLEDRIKKQYDDEMQKERKKRMDIQEENKKLKDKIKELEKDLKITRKTGA